MVPKAQAATLRDFPAETRLSHDSVPLQSHSHCLHHLFEIHRSRQTRILFGHPSHIHSNTSSHLLLEDLASLPQYNACNPQPITYVPLLPKDIWFKVSLVQILYHIDTYTRNIPSQLCSSISIPFLSSPSTFSLRRYDYELVIRKGQHVNSKLNSEIYCFCRWFHQRQDVGAAIRYNR